MTDIDSSKFKIRFDDERPDSQFPEEIEDPKVEKFSRRITLFAIFFPCLIVIILAAAYFNINKRVVSLQDTGISTVQNLSRDLEERFTSVSAKQAQLEESFAKTISALQAELKEATAAIKHIRSAREIDNKKFKEEIDNLNKTLTAVAKNFETASSGIKNVESGFKQQLAGLAETIDNQKSKINKLQTDMAALASAKIDQKTLDLALLNQQKKYQQELSKTIKSLEDKIEAIRKMASSVAAGQAAIKNRSAETAPAGKPVNESVVTKPGKIIEQDIVE